MFKGPLSQQGKARLQTMYQTQDGFEIARRDLSIRGPGEFLGARQSGEVWLRFADLERDEELLVKAQHSAIWMLRERPDLARRHVDLWLGEAANFLEA